MPTGKDTQVLSVIRAQHEAIDALMARLVLLDCNFRPTQSALIWKAVTDGHELMQLLERKAVVDGHELVQLFERSL